MSAPALSLEAVSVDFAVSSGLFAPQRTLHALRDVTLAVNAGETLGLVGESGCGKSTLAKVLLGMIAPQAGVVRLGGQPLAGISRAARARQLQPVFQDPYSSLNPMRTIGEAIAQPLRLHEKGADIDGRVSAMMERVGLPVRLTSAYPSQLSGGQRQRVAIARALILGPKVLICDEPTSALDVSVQAQVLNLLIELKRDMGLSMLFISHNLAVVEHIADRVSIMYLGEIVEEGAAGTIMRAPRHPYAAALMSAALPPDPAHGLRPPAMGQSAADPFADEGGCLFRPRCPKAAELCLSRPPVLMEVDGMVRCHFGGAGEE